MLTLRTFPTENPLEKDERSVWANLVFGKDRVFELKYSTGNLDPDRLRAELAGSPLPTSSVEDDDVDPYAPEDDDDEDAPAR